MDTLKRYDVFCESAGRTFIRPNVWAKSRMAALLDTLNIARMRYIDTNFVVTEVQNANRDTNVRPFKR